MVKEFENPEYAFILGEKVLYCSIDNKCKTNYAVDGILKIKNVEEIYGYDLEADTRVMFHVMHADKENSGNIIVRGTDIFVILVANAFKMENKIWFDTGLDHDNSCKYVDIKAISENIEYARALPGIYAFTGIDYIPAFFKKGKERPIALMGNNAKFVEAFSTFGESELTPDIISIIEEFTCAM